MRAFWAAAALAVLAACSSEVSVNSPDDSTQEGYTLEVRANEGEQLFLVTSPEGRTVGAHAEDGVSALMDRSAVRALGPAPETPASGGDETVSMRFPGFSLSVSGDGEGEGENGRVALRAGSGAHGIEINADEGGPGEADDRAHVVIRGVSEADARDFIAKADQLSPQVQAQMLAELGLD